MAVAAPVFPAPSCESALFATLQARHPDTGHHSDRVVSLCTALGARCGLPSTELAALAVCARLHDLGKVGVPDRVIYHPGRLVGDDWAVMQSHSDIGADIIMRSDLPNRAFIAEGVRHHHEHFDGSGYPQGLKGGDIVLHARILSLADSYDALSDVRPYHPARQHVQIMDILQSEVGRKSDPDLLHVFENMIEHSELRVR